MLRQGVIGALATSRPVRSSLLWATGPLAQKVETGLGLIAILMDLRQPHTAANLRGRSPLTCLPGRLVGQW